MKTIVQCTNTKPSPFRLLDIFESTVKLLDGNGFNNDKMKERQRKKNESKQKMKMNILEIPNVVSTTIVDNQSSRIITHILDVHSNVGH